MAGSWVSPCAGPARCFRWHDRHRVIPTRGDVAALAAITAHDNPYEIKRGFGVAPMLEGSEIPRVGITRLHGHCYQTVPPLGHIDCIASSGPRNWRMPHKSPLSSLPRCTDSNATREEVSATYTKTWKR